MEKLTPSSTLAAYVTLRTGWHVVATCRGARDRRGAACAIAARRGMKGPLSPQPKACAHVSALWKKCLV